MSGYLLQRHLLASVTKRHFFSETPLCWVYRVRRCWS